MKTLTDTDGAQKERKSEEEKEKVAQPNTEYATNVTNTNKKEKKKTMPQRIFAEGTIQGSNPPLCPLDAK